MQHATTPRTARIADTPFGYTLSLIGGKMCIRDRSCFTQITMPEPIQFHQ